MNDKWVYIFCGCFTLLFCLFIVLQAKIALDDKEQEITRYQYLLERISSLPPKELLEKVNRNTIMIEKLIDESKN